MFIHCPLHMLMWILSLQIWHGQNITPECSSSHHQRNKPNQPSRQQTLRVIQSSLCIIIGITIYSYIEIQNLWVIFGSSGCPKCHILQQILFVLPSLSWVHDLLSISIITTLSQPTIMYSLGLSQLTRSVPLISKLAFHTILHKAAWLILENVTWTMSYLCF